MIWSNKSYNEHTKSTGRFVWTIEEINFWMIPHRAKHERQLLLM